MKSVGGVETENYGFWGREALLDGFSSADGELLYAWKMYSQGDMQLESPCTILPTLSFVITTYFWTTMFDGANHHKSKKIKAAHWFKIDNIFICSAPGNPCYFVVVVFPSVPRCAGARSPQTSFCYFHKPSYWIIERGKCLTCFYKFLAALLWSATVCWVWKKHSVASPDNDASP